MHPYRAACAQCRAEGCGHVEAKPQAQGSTTVLVLACLDYCMYGLAHGQVVGLWLCAWGEKHQSGYSDRWMRYPTVHACWRL